jgi:AcrR family transcriptional regulator
MNRGPEASLSRAAPPSRRALNQAAIRSRLVAAAIRLGLRRGFDRTTVAEIAAAAGVAKGTFFNYFPTKEALVVEHYRQLFAAIRSIVSAMPPLPAREWFRLLFQRMAAAVVAERNTVRLVFNQGNRLAGITALEKRSYRWLHRAYVRALEEGQAAGQIGAARSADSAAHVLQAVWSGALEEWAGRSGDLAGELGRRIDLVFEGLSA